jgi:hypothetical protein
MRQISQEGWIGIQNVQQIREVPARDAAQVVCLDPKKHLEALEIDGSSGAVDGKKDVHEVALEPMSAMTDCMASTLAIASIDVRDVAGVCVTG